MKTTKNSEKKKNTRLGEVRRMNNGVFATIVEYNNANDITVKIGNQLVQHTKYQHFLNGNIKAHIVNFETHLNEVSKMKNGQYAKIIDYRSYYDIDIEFFDDDKTVVNTTYSSFHSGATINPNYNSLTRRRDSKKNIPKLRLNEQMKMKNGEVATIIAYRSSTDIDIQFDNGEIRYNVGYFRFKNGDLKSHSFKKNL